MRAARVLDMLLVLQRRGRLTARDLAETLEVSERTVLRDVEALSEAGVPIRTARGAGGGIELMDTFAPRLTALGTDEARCLLLAGQPQVAHRLGLAAPARTATNKLLASLPPALADQAGALPTWFLHDPDPWTGNRIPHGELRRLVRCIHEHRRVELSFARGPEVAARPLGLVVKAGSWFVVSSSADAGGACDQGGDDVDVICLDDLRATRIRNQVFVPPERFDLAACWARALGGNRAAAASPERTAPSTHG